MVDACRELHSRWLEGVISGELDLKKEDSACVWTVFRSRDRCLPAELVGIVGGAGGAIGERIASQVDKLFLNSFKCHMLRIMTKFLSSFSCFNFYFL